MLGLPAQVLGAVLPEESKTHFKAAGRETMLAVYSLWRKVERSAKGPPRKRFAAILRWNEEVARKNAQVHDPPQRRRTRRE